MDTKRMFHYEGGWPGEVDVTEEKARLNHIKKKLEKHPDTGVDIFTDSCRRMCSNVKDIIKMNNQIDMFEEYFENEVPDHNIEKLSVKTLLLFKDPEKGHRRCINKISWHPDGPHKLAGAYCMMRFHKPMAMTDLSCRSMVWDLNSPNEPVHYINPPSPITALAYNHKNVDDIAFGTYNGRVGFVDVRVDNNRISADQISDVEESHHEPVMDVIWLSSKLNNEFVTCSSDGKIMWWDNRKLSKPIDKLFVCESDGPKAEDGTPMNLIGGTSLEFVPDHGPKYLIGTEKGSIMLANKKPKKAAELNYNVSYGLSIGRHLGPIYSIKRNPTNLKYFMSVGDWSVNIWEEETKAPIMKTRYHQSYLTDGCWSPQRPGVFFVTRKDGWLDIWDYYYRQNEVAFSHKVSDYPLTTIKVNNVTGTSQIGVAHYDNGKYVAIGDNDGTITLLELCKTLYEPQPHENVTLSEIFIREKSREEHLKMQRMLLETKKKQQAKDKSAAEKLAEQAPTKDHLEKQAKDIEDEFEESLRKAAEDLYKVYIDDPEYTAILTERLSHKSEKKATKDIKNAQELTTRKAEVPKDYDKKVDELSEGASNYFPPSKETFCNSFVASGLEKLIVSATRSGDNGREVTKIIEWKCSSKERGDQELFTFDTDVACDPSFKEGKPSPVQEMQYLFIDSAGRIVGIDKFGIIVLMDVDKAKGTVSNPRIIGECYCPEKCGAAISRDKKSLYYIDKTESAKIWKHDLTSHKKVEFVISDKGSYTEIASFCLVNDETLFVCLKNGKACRYDIVKKSFERAVQFEGVPTYITSHLNYVAVVGNLKDINMEVSDTHEILLLDHELREVGRYNLREFNNVVCLGMEVSVSQTPIILCSTPKEFFTLKLQNDGKLGKTNLSLAIKELKGEGMHHFILFKNHVIASDKEGFLVIPLKGDMDDPEKMAELANVLEEKHDKVREDEDKLIEKKIKDQEADLEKKRIEEEKLKKEKEEAEKKRQADILKEMDYQNQTVSFLNPQLVYHKITGNILDNKVSNLTDSFREEISFTPLLKKARSLPSRNST